MTAFSKASLVDGSSGPVTFTVTGARAALCSGLGRPAPRARSSIGACIEDFLLFKLVIRRAGGLAAGAGTPLAGTAWRPWA